MSKLIFISGVIGDGHTVSAREMYRNVRTGEHFMFELMQKNWTVYCPHLSYHMWIDQPQEISWEKWMMQDYGILEKADAMLYMNPKIYGKSKGSELELKWFRKFGKPVYKLLSDVPKLPEPYYIHT